MKVCFFSLGCDKNKTDSMKILFYLQKKFDISFVERPEDSDVAIVNTCAFIKDAKDESIETIKYLENIKGKSNLKKILVLGCLTKDKTINIKNIIKKEDVILSIDKYLHGLFDMNDRIADILSFSSSIKISDGCNKNCSYCIIPKLRGKYKSNTIENLYAETKKLVKNGTKELSIVAQDTLNYGVDIYHKRAIVKLVSRLSTINDLSWIRLLYCYPEEIDDELIDMIKNNDKVLHYIDMPIQHISNKILKLMNRPTTKEKVLNLVYNLRKKIPDIIIRTTFIVGFPGETEDDFNELLDFIKIIKFDKVGAFTYSREKNSLSYNYKNQIDEKTKRNRLKKLLDIQHAIVIEKKKSYIGNIYKCIVDGYNTINDMYMVRSYMDSKDIDEVVYVKSDKSLISGTFIDVKIIDTADIDLIGVCV